MKNKEIQELKNKSTPELEKLFRDYQEQLHGLKFDLAAGKVKNVTTLRVLRKNIARVLTFLHLREGSHNNLKS